MKILVLDNYDSFTYNLVQYIAELTGETPSVFRNDAINLDDVDAYDFIVLSPGPGLPSEAGIMPELITRYGHTKHISGVCLGMQAIGEAYGGELYNLPKVYHGVATNVNILVEDEKLFEGLEKQIEVGRYHSWVINPEGFPETLEITSLDENGQIMSIRHKKFDVRGVQFHPESVLTPHGKKMLENWVKS